MTDALKSIHDEPDTVELPVASPTVDGQGVLVTIPGCTCGPHALREEVADDLMREIGWALKECEYDRLAGKPIDPRPDAIVEGPPP